MTQRPGNRSVAESTVPMRVTRKETKHFLSAAVFGFTLLTSCVFSADPVLSQEEDEVKAKSEVRKAIEHLVLAERALSRREFEEAIEQAKKAGELAGRDVRLLQGAAELLYRAGDAEASVPLFDQVVLLAPESASRNWQRGLALCSCGLWEKGAEQFKTHHDVNPDDVENSAWYFLCVAKTEGIEAARKTVIPSRGDGREPMMSVLKMLKETITPEEVIQAAIDNTPEGRRRKQAQFYADLYVGLYYHSLDDVPNARKYLKRSQSYGIDGYMVDSARVYLQDQLTDLEKPEKEAEE